MAIARHPKSHKRIAESGVAFDEGDRLSGQFQRKKRLLVSGGVGALLIGGLGVLFLAPEGDDPHSTPAETTIDETTSTTEAPKSAGNFSIADAVKPNERYMQISRANKDVIRIPYLRNTDNLDSFGESALAILACYITTGDEQCKTAFTESPLAQEGLESLRQVIFIDPVAGLNLESRPNFQIVIYDDPEKPVHFVRNVENPNIIEADGPINFQFSDDEKWQDTSSVLTQGWANVRFDKLQFVMQGDELVDMSYHYASIENL